MSLYCTNCGKPIAEADNFCGHCGFEHVAQRTPQSQTESSTDVETKIEPEAPEEKVPKSRIAVDVQEVSEENVSEFFGGRYHPWRRFFARSVDLLTLGVLLASAMAIGLAYVAPDMLVLMENPLVAGIFLYIAWIPLEAVLITLFGTTPGKWVFGIKIIGRDGVKLALPKTLRRSALVFIQGEGLAIPIVTIFTRYFAYNKLTSTGSTLWDDAVGSVVLHSRWGVGRWIASLSAVILAMSVLVILNNLPEYMPEPDPVAELEAEIQQLKSTLPQMLDESTRFDDVIYQSGAVSYFYTYLGEGDLDANAIREILKEGSCSSFGTAIESMRYVYRHEFGHIMADVQFVESDCLR